MKVKEMKRSVCNYDRFYLLALLACIGGCSLFGGSAVMLFDDGKYTFEQIKYATLIGLFFPCLLVALLSFYVLMKKAKRWQLAIWVWVFPIAAEGLAAYYLDNGYLPSQYLPKDDYRHFMGTPAYHLVRDIVRGKGVSDGKMNSIDYQDSASGMTPLLFCIRNGYYVDAVKLLEIGASPNIADCNRHTSPLIELCQSHLSDSISNPDKLRVLDILLDKGADVNYKVEGKWPLLILCSTDQIDSVWCNHLLEHGADLNIMNIQQDDYLHECYKENETALNMTLYHGNFRFAQSLLEQGADTTGYRDWMIDILQSKYNDSIEKNPLVQNLLEYLHPN